jgi:hypothetical protein
MKHALLVIDVIGNEDADLHEGFDTIAGLTDGTLIDTSRGATPIRSPRIESMVPLDVLQ